MLLNRQTLFILSIITLFGFSALGFSIIWAFVSEYSPIDLFTVGMVWYKQLFFGGLFGLSGVFFALWIMNGKWHETSKLYFTAMVERINPSYFDIIFYSLCAGIGEEILFRSAIQPFIGIWPTAILFIVLHGYINPFNWPITIYGISMVVVSAGFGYLFQYYGIYAAIAAHALFDIVMFIYFKHIGRKIENLPEDFR